MKNLIIGLALAAVLALAACGGGEAEPTATPTTEPTATATPTPTATPTATPTPTPTSQPTPTATPTPTPEPQTLEDTGRGPTAALSLGQAAGGEYGCLMEWSGNEYEHGAHAFEFELEAGDAYEYEARYESARGSKYVTLDVAAGQTLLLTVLAADAAEWAIACSNQ